MDELFHDLADSQDKGMLVLPRLDKERVLRAYREKDEYDGEWNWKLYPSSLSWDMCPADYIYNQVSKGKTFPITAKSQERMALGTARHSEWQDLLLTTKFLYDKPNYPDFILAEQARKMKDKKKRKKVKKWPEVYVYCPYWAVSGYIDAVIKDKKKPWIIDFKTTNDHPINKWDENKLKLPKIAQETQAYIYAVIVDKYNYYPDKIEGIRLCYYNNPCFEHKEVDPRWEWSEKINAGKYEKTICLMDNLRSSMLRLFCKMPFKCEYKHCRKHNQD